MLIRNSVIALLMFGTTVITPASRAGYGSIVQTGSQTAEIVKVPAGSFAMGCDRPKNMDCDDDENIANFVPPLSVTLSAFEIDRTEVTQRAYQACIAAGKCTPPAGDFDPVRQGDHPVRTITWEQAAAYCASVGKRLPTEAEWEKAARGTDGRKYPWGNEEPTCARANFSGCNTPDGPRPVGSYPSGVSPYGALDMAGNVWEWVNDWYSRSYTGGPQTDPQGPKSVTYDPKVIRGGGFQTRGPNVRTTNRGFLFYKKPESYAGCRCARSLNR